jgi:hypothetical protein
MWQVLFIKQPVDTEATSAAKFFQIIMRGQGKAFDQHWLPAKRTRLLIFYNGHKDASMTL